MFTVLSAPSTIDHRRRTWVLSSGSGGPWFFNEVVTPSSHPFSTRLGKDLLFFMGPLSRLDAPRLPAITCALGGPAGPLLAKIHLSHRVKSVIKHDQQVPPSSNTASKGADFPFVCWTRLATRGILSS